MIHLDQTLVYVALGDLQCTLNSCFENGSDCVINISTSSQICIAIDASQVDRFKPLLPSSVNSVSFYGNKALLVAASLNGGNVLDSFVHMVLDWNRELGFNYDVPEATDMKSAIWPKLLDLSDDWCNKNPISKLRCRPLLFGERHANHTFASMLNISTGNTSIGEIFSSICFGIVENLNDMFPFDLVVNKLGCKRLVATGGALLRNPILKLGLEKTFKNVPIVYMAQGDAAKGAVQFIKYFKF